MYHRDSDILRDEPKPEAFIPQLQGLGLIGTWLQTTFALVFDNKTADDLYPFHQASQFLPISLCSQKSKSQVLKGLIQLPPRCCKHSPMTEHHYFFIWMAP